MGVPWSDEMVEQLKDLWLQQNLSATSCAQRLGVTRNSVLAKVHRLKLPTRDQDSRKRITVTRRPRRVPSLHRTDPNGRNHIPGAREKALADLDRALEATDLSPDESPHAVALLDLQDHHCRWPLGDPATPDFRFCGDQHMTGFPYCRRHARMAYSRGRAA